MAFWSPRRGCALSPIRALVPEKRAVSPVPGTMRTVTDSPLTTHGRRGSTPGPDDRTRGAPSSPPSLPGGSRGLAKASDGADDVIRRRGRGLGGRDGEESGAVFGWHGQPGAGPGEHERGPPVHAARGQRPVPTSGVLRPGGGHVRRGGRVDAMGAASVASGRDAFGVRHRQNLAEAYTG